MVFLDFGEPGDIQDWYRSRKILTCLYCMPGFGLVESSGLKSITADQFTLWHFGNFFVPFGIPKMIVVDADGPFVVIFNNTSQ